MLLQPVSAVLLFICPSAGSSMSQPVRVAKPRTLTITSQAREPAEA